MMRRRREGEGPPWRRHRRSREGGERWDMRRTTPYWLVNASVGGVRCVVLLWRVGRGGELAERSGGQEEKMRPMTCTRCRHEVVST